MHEYLDGFALINMNGRVYDPQIARFLSPDPQLQSPGYWLNYNRYGYCFNNPLLYTDPSGEVAWLPILAMAYFGEVQANFMHAAENGGNPFNPGNWDWESGWTYYGIASGAFAGYSQALQHCEYANDIVTGERTLISHLGDGKLNFERYGVWVDNHTAFKKIGSTVIENVALGGVNNIRGVAGAAFAANGIIIAAKGGWSDTYSFNRIGFVPLDEKVGYQMANYRMNFRASTSMEPIIGNDYSIQGRQRVLNISAISKTTLVSGEVSGSASAALMINGNTISSQSLLPSGTNLVNADSYYIGSASFNIPDTGNIQIGLRGSWVVSAPGGRSVPVYHPIAYPVPININTTISIP